MMPSMKELPSIAERRRLAEMAGIVEPYLYQCLSNRREMGAAEATRIEAATGGEVRRWDVCQKTWHLIWPELTKVKGAPVIEAVRA